METPPNNSEAKEIKPIEEGAVALETYLVSETTGNPEEDQKKIDEIHKNLAEKGISTPIAETVPLEVPEKYVKKKGGSEKHRSTAALFGIHAAKLISSAFLLPLSYLLKSPGKIIDWSFKIAKLPGADGSSGGGGGAKPAAKKPSGGGGGGHH